MSVHARNGAWDVRWRSAGRQRSKTFAVLADAERFDAKIRRRKQNGGSALLLHHLVRSDLGEQVYVLRGGDKVKVGRATDPVGRIADLQTGSPVPLMIAWRIETPDAKRLEAALHRRYAEHRALGEWFEADPVLADLAALADLGPHRIESVGGVATRLDQSWIRRSELDRGGNHRGPESPAP
jgi:hypothetical protein